MRGIPHRLAASAINMPDCIMANAESNSSFFYLLLGDLIGLYVCGIFEFSKSAGHYSIIVMGYRAEGMQRAGRRTFTHIIHTCREPMMQRAYEAEPWQLL